MFAAYVQNPENPKLEAAHIVDAIEKTVPLSTTMKEQINSLRNWAATRAKMHLQNQIMKNKRKKCLFFLHVLNLNWNVLLT